jgi:hypothetical protein
MEAELHRCPHCGGEIEGMALSYNEENRALHFEMDHGDMACHFDLDFSPVFLTMGLDHLFRIFQRIAERHLECLSSIEASPTAKGFHC